MEDQAVSGQIIKKRFPFLIIIPLIILIIVVLTVFGVKKFTVNVTPQANSVIMQVGEEKIYKSDLNSELAAYPPNEENSKEVEKKLLEKIATDSITLQAARKANFIDSLDKNVFNSPEKDYMKRIELIKKIKNDHDQSMSMISGTVISIWFFNAKPGPVGYEKGKEIAYEKISKIHAQVKSKSITVKQAAELIRNDTSLDQVDTSYKTNAELNFSTVINNDTTNNITFDVDFNTVLQSLNEGEVSDIYTVKDKKPNSQEKQDALYMFGVIDKKTINSNQSFDDWLKSGKNTYEITYL